MQQDRRRRGARVDVRRRDMVVPWWAWALVAGGVVAALPTLAQTSDGAASSSPVPGVQGPAEGAAPSGQVPEVVKPAPSATLPPGNDGTTTATPQSENPQVGGTRPIPDRGVIAPPANGAASTPVIRPPSVGSMPVIPPPGSPGGDRGVVPK